MSKKSERLAQRKALNAEAEEKENQAAEWDRKIKKLEKVKKKLAEYKTELSTKEKKIEKLTTEEQSKFKGSVRRKFNQKVDKASNQSKKLETTIKNNQDKIENKISDLSLEAGMLENEAALLRQNAAGLII